MSPNLYHTLSHSLPRREGRAQHSKLNIKKKIITLLLYAYFVKREDDGAHGEGVCTRRERERMHMWIGSVYKEREGV